MPLFVIGAEYRQHSGAALLNLVWFPQCKWAVLSMCSTEAVEVLNNWGMLASYPGLPCARAGKAWVRG